MTYKVWFYVVFAMITAARVVSETRIKKIDDTVLDISFVCEEVLVWALFAIGVNHL